MIKRWRRSLFTMVLALSSPGLMAEVPKDLKWERGGEVPAIGSPKAKKGGLLRVPLRTFPLTLRTVGPDSNTVLYMSLLANQLGLITYHPNTRQPFGVIATEWAFGKDGRSVYYRLNPKARWSDGKPVTPEDFEFIIPFYRSKNLNAPWYNTYYTEQLESVTKVADHVIKVTLPKPKPDLLYHTALSPVPKHFYNGKVPKDFVQKYNWKPVPNTGPYYVDPKAIKKGRSVTWRRKKDWWLKDHPYVQGRFNVDRIIYKVVREQTVRWERFKAGKLDLFDMTEPLYWYERSNIDLFKKGYAGKLWFYNSMPRSCSGWWFNLKKSKLQDINMRRAIAHALNTDKVNKNLLRGERERLQSCWDEYGKYSHPELSALPYDLDKATDYLAKAGYDKVGKDGIRVNSKGQKASVKLLYANDSVQNQMVLVVEEMKKAGIELELEFRDWSAMIKKMDAQEHEISFSGFGARSYGVPTYWGIWHGVNAGKPSTNNNTNLNDPQINKDIEAYRDSVSEDERIMLSRKIQKRIEDQVVFIPYLKAPWFRIGFHRWISWPDTPGTKMTSSPASSYSELFSFSGGGLLWIDQEMKERVEKAKDRGKSIGELTIVDTTYKVKK